MPTSFASAENRAWQSWNRKFGELWDLQPMMDSAGGGRRVVDAARDPVLGFTGVFSSPVKESTEFGTEARGTLPRFVNETFLSIDMRQFGEGSAPRRLDRVTRRETGKVYELGHGQVDGEGCYRFWIKAL